MFDINSDKDKKIHMIGIGGISMSGLAEILLYYGYKVSGSDRAESNLTEKLSHHGAKIYAGHDASNIGDADIVVYTAAVRDDNPEIVEAKRRGIVLMDRAEFLGHIMKKFSKSIAVSGTHGKTTTTSMISLMLLDAGLDPTIMVGGEVDAIGGNVKPGKSSYLVAEACEYKGSFLKFYPYIGIVLNIDADHLDFYKDINEIYDTFLKFSKLIPDDGLFIGCADDSRVKDICDQLCCNVVTYGIKDGDFTAGDIEYDEMGYPSFKAYYKGSYFDDFKLHIPGEHNVSNALAAIACCHYLGVSAETMKSSLDRYKGTHRRFEKKGVSKGVVVIDDYAHHPSEIKATIKAAANYPHKRLYCVFQPHTYSRTITLFNEFASAFAGLDKLMLTDIYAAREIDTGVVSSSMLCDAITKNGVKAEYLKTFDDVIEKLKIELEDGDVLLTMGAGDVYKIGENFLK